MKNIFKNNSFTNVMLEEKLGEELATGKVVIAHFEPTSNPEWISAYLVQKRTVESRGNTESNKLSNVSRTLKGFDQRSNNYIVRHIENISADVCQSMKLSVGDTIEDAIIGIKDSFQPQQPNQKPHMDKEGNIRLSNGKPFYTHTYLADLTEYPGDSVMLFDAPVAKEEKQAPVTTAFTDRTRKPR